MITIIEILAAIAYLILTAVLCFLIYKFTKFLREDIKKEKKQNV